MFITNPSVNALSSELIASFEGVCPSTIGHMQDHGFIRNLQPLLAGKKILGRAVTVRIPHLDSCAVHKAFDILQPGDVLVIDTNKDYERAPFGEMVCYAARAAKVAGVIIDGCVTDYAAIKQLGVQVWFRRISPLTTRIRGIEGAVNVPVCVDNVVINPGDLIIADDDGVLALCHKRADLAELAQTVIAKQNAEADIKARIDAGEKLGQITGASKYFA